MANWLVIQQGYRRQGDFVHGVALGDSDAGLKSECFCSFSESSQRYSLKVVLHQIRNLGQRHS